MGSLWYVDYPTVSFSCNVYIHKYLICFPIAIVIWISLYVQAGSTCIQQMHLAVDRRMTRHHLLDFMLSSKGLYIAKSSRNPTDHVSAMYQMAANSIFSYYYSSNLHQDHHLPLRQTSALPSLRPRFRYKHCL